MQLIKLSQGLSAMVDDKDFQFLNQFKWYARKSLHTSYAARKSSAVDGKRRVIHMHRVIANTPEDMETDHKDRNGLNNQGGNLRNVTHQQNLYNTGAKGYYFKKDEKKFLASINFSGETKYLGYFDTEQEARKAYLDAKKIYHVIN